MKTSEQGVSLIKLYEIFSARVYSDVGKPAIGYGHDLLPNEVYASGISEADADALLRLDLATRYEPAVNALIPNGCTQSQFDALVDFAYNLGNGSLKTMLGHGWEDVPNQILRWNHVLGAVNLGLTKRRQAEVDLFNSR
jgi:GH24 family phage-related lysozyme (muramidase)